MEIICSECGLKFSHRSNLSRHKRMRHKVEESFPCVDCGKSFTRKDSLKVHSSTQHSTIERERFTCAECGKSFSKKSNLKRHSSTQHSSIERERFTCDECGKSFTAKCSLKRHSSSKHSIIERERVKCEECGKSFTAKCSLKRHLSTKRASSTKSVQQIASTDNLDASTSFRSDDQRLDSTCTADRPSRRDEDETFELDECFTVDFDKVAKVEPPSPAPSDTLVEDMEDPLPVDYFNMAQCTPKREYDPLPDDCFTKAQSTPKMEYDPLPDDCFTKAQSTPKMEYEPLPVDCLNMAQSTPKREYDPLPVDCFNKTQSTPKREYYDPATSDCFNVTYNNPKSCYDAVPKECFEVKEETYVAVPYECFEVKEETIYDVAPADSLDVTESTLGMGIDPLPVDCFNKTQNTPKREYMTMSRASTSTAMPSTTPHPYDNDQPRIPPDLPARVQHWIHEESLDQNMSTSSSSGSLCDDDDTPEVQAVDSSCNQLKTRIK